jgi:CheY-like chemotaxis protein
MPSHIIVANDDPVYLDLIKDLLIEEGYLHIRCIEGPAAFTMILEQQPDLVLLDINFTNAGQGWKTLDMLRLNPRTTKIPVVVCSTDGRMLKEKAEWLRSMRCETQEKPFNLQALLEKIQLILSPPPEQTNEAGR